MKIAIAIHKLDAGHGGAGSSTIQYAQWLKERGHHVEFYCIQAAPDCGFDQSLVHIIGTGHDRFASAEALDLELRICDADIVHDMGLGKTSDIFHSHFGSLKAMEMAKLKANTLARRIANRIARPFARRKRRLQSLSAAQFSQSTAWYVAVSTMAAIGLNKLEGIPRERIFTIANGIDTSRFHPDAAHRRRQSVRQKLAIGDDEIVLATIAHNHRLKGIPQLIDYLRRAGSIPMTIHALIAGGHSQRPKRLSIGKHTVTYLGLVNDPLDAFAATDIYVHPTFYDACSLTVLEAMACGLPTITTPCNGASERIRHGTNGFIVESARDADGLSKAFNDLRSPTNRMRIGTAARVEAERWTQEDNFLSIEMLYYAKVEQKNEAMELRRRAFEDSKPMFKSAKCG